MKTYIVKLSPESAFHALPSSDTLFGALCWSIRRLCGNERLKEVLTEIDNNPLFVLSSAFPILEVKGSDALYFLPKPVTTGITVYDVEAIAGRNNKKVQVIVITEYKKYKKAEYVSESIFLDVQKGASDRSVFEQYMKENIVLFSNILMTKDEYNLIDAHLKIKPFISSVVQKNAIDRLSMSTGEEGQTFYQQEIYASKIFGLYFLMKTSNVSFFTPLLRYLEDKGIGGNRSTGKGRFKIKVIGEKSLPDSADVKTFLNLSRFIPSNGDIDLNSHRNCYEVFPYRSKVDSEYEFKGDDVWKDRVMYLKEGSVLVANEKKPFYGRCPIVKEIDGQKVRQNGMALPVFGKFGGIH